MESGMQLEKIFPGGRFVDTYALAEDIRDNNVDESLLEMVEVGLKERRLVAPREEGYSMICNEPMSEIVESFFKRASLQKSCAESLVDAFNKTNPRASYAVCRSNCF